MSYYSRKYCILYICSGLLFFYHFKLTQLCVIRQCTVVSCFQSCKGGFHTKEAKSRQLREQQLKTSISPFLPLQTSTGTLNRNCSQSNQWEAPYCKAKLSSVDHKIPLSIKWGALSTGIPQGCVLGPLLLFLYTHSLDKVISFHWFSCDCYAGNTLLYFPTF